MREIIKSPKGVKSGVPERMNISCPTCGTMNIYLVSQFYL